MKKVLKIVVLVASVLINHFSSAQNLVPNPSFEDTVMCPDMGGQVARARYWHTLDNTPDYFHECCIYQQFSVPSNTFGYQYAATGAAYCGFSTYSTVSFYRETIGTFLINPLIVGTKYYITFKVNYSRKEPSSPSNLGTNKTGILFSTVDYFTSSPPYTNFSQVYTDSIITDTVNWVTIRGSFIADSVYAYISIGNFFDDTHIDTVQFTGFPTGNAYYFIDDVCVSTDSLYSEQWENVAEQTNNSGIVLYPNPAYNQITVNNIEFDYKQIQLFDISGKLLQAISINRNNKIVLDISSLSVGIYSLVFHKDNSISVKKFIKSLN